jgi:SAM-dependent methyltransferase
MTAPDDARRFAPATLRNRDPILAVLRRVLPPAGVVLEVASGTGEHVLHFARHLPGLEWQPSDPSPEARASIVAWAEAERRSNVRAPLDIDAARAPWPIERADAVVCINMIHISPWAATIGLMRGAGRLLTRGSPLVLYGPFRRSDRALEPGNVSFDLDLQARDSRWGLRQLDDVIACAADHALAFEETIEMPANNLSVVFRKL